MSNTLEKNRIQRSIAKALKKAKQSPSLPLEARALIEMSEREVVDITPKKGVDYFTKEDVQEIVAQVIDTLKNTKN